MEKVNKKDYDILQTAYERLVHQYTAVVNQNKSLQQYPKLFNEQIFKGFTPEEVIEAAKVQILQKSGNELHNNSCSAEKETNHEEV